MRDAQQILAEANVIAVVGASRDPFKSAHTVPRQMLRHGWRIIPVNPFADEVFGVPAVATLADIGEPIDLVNVFRPARDAVDVVRQAIEIKAPAVWLQSGIFSTEARRLAEEADIDYIEDRCLAVERAAGNLSRLP
ncbi:CoA-binding protein [Paractinoplanes ferrugineus]|uniref:Succinyl-CoA ligase subunit alpha n=1 Tax=Paractinoplanes ferrugineus TaxID=113564 RepID=A0A919IT52_9ACTN|nr:CoA-binding protein [Actinoplanes ferrugineus]GIE08515.1 succinyl-CoA ligase subunit alpha [Actinoplanes ferrugineus]